VLDDFAQRPRPASLEIVEAGFFSRDAMPQGVTGGTLRRLEEIAGRRPPATRW